MEQIPSSKAKISTLQIPRNLRIPKFHHLFTKPATDPYPKADEPNPGPPNSFIYSPLCNCPVLLIRNISYKI